MKVDILTLFPEMFEGAFSESIIKRAREKEIVEITIHNLRDWAKDKHNTVDDRPYGGGAGMVIKVDVVDSALTHLRRKESRVLLMDARGDTFTQKKAGKLAKEKHLIILCGHYEDFDGRVREHLVDEVISIGDFVLTGGEIPAMAIVDSIVRLLPGTIEKESLEDETHKEKGYKKYHQYTRPEKYKGWKVPAILLTGNHPEIEKWRKGNN